MGNFLDECLRMWPPATGILARVTREPVKIGPYSLPEGMLIGTNILGLMHNPKYYEDPSVFNPDRWATKKPQSG
jgi:cytochrome P450